ncbi:ABC transporter substrate-binding protein [Halorhabdus rudnickae]|uniref:ABC transporter substrate-binding protein n=1 Tax=Halorhabdus rudnickae TaxID=1775544 RepID=UPI00143849A5|nr:ABC transporter substrate-binding protein [Halorhabdus rudnickae]
MDRHSEGKSTIDLAHHYVSGDGADALSALLDGFEESHPKTGIDTTQCDNLRLQVKTLILQERPPDVWVAWPGENLREYVAAGVVRDITEIWEHTDAEESVRPVATQAVNFDGSYRAVPVSIHRVNDLYIHRQRAEDMGIELESITTPEELAMELRAAAEENRSSPVLFPMVDPWTVLQLFEVVLLGQYDTSVFEAITAGDVDQHEEAITTSLEILQTIASVSADQSLHWSMVDTNERFLSGESPLYPQGDWAGGAFVERSGFAYQSDWDRIPFPGTERQYMVAMDAFIPSASASAAEDKLRQFAEYVLSKRGQRQFNNQKGSVPVRNDCTTQSFSAFTRDQMHALDESHSQPKSITHGLSVTPSQLIDLKTTMAEFIDTHDVDRTAGNLVDIFRRR